MKAACPAAALILGYPAAALILSLSKDEGGALSALCKAFEPPGKTL